MGTHDENDNVSVPQITSRIAGSSETPPAYSKPGSIGKRTDGNGDTGPLMIGRRGYGFPRGCYFLIKERGRDLYMVAHGYSSAEGTWVCLWPLQPVNDIGLKNQVRLAHNRLLCIY